MTVDQPLISVIVPHLNQPRELEACLSSLDAQSLDPGRFEVIVVDNGSTTYPEQIVMRHPGTCLFKEIAPGPGPARNTGVRHAKADVFAFIDADCRAHHLWLETALQTIRHERERTILGGDVRIWRDDETRFTAIEAYESVFSYRFKHYIEHQGFSGTGNLVVRRADFEAVGSFAGIQIAEDLEWGRRARAAGCHFLYVEDLIVFHPARSTLTALYAKWDRLIHHSFNMTKGTSLWKLRWILRALAIFASPFVDFTKVLRSERVSGVWPKLQATMILFAVRSHRARKMLTLLRERQTLTWNQQTEA